MITILVCGGRDFDDYSLMENTLTQIHKQLGISQLIHGDARGADRLSGAWASKNGIAVTAVPADWNKFGKSAGFRRNETMARMSPDLVVAFPGGKGTEHMINLCKSMKLTVRIVK